MPNSADPNLEILKELEKVAQALGSWRNNLVLGGGVALIKRLA